MKVKLKSQLEIIRDINRNTHRSYRLFDALLSQRPSAPRLQSIKPEKYGRQKHD